MQGPGTSGFARSWVIVIATCLCGACLTTAAAAAESHVAERQRVARDYPLLAQRARERGSIPIIVRFKVDPPDGRSRAERKEAGRRRLQAAMVRSNIRSFAEFERSGLSAYAVNADQLDALLDSGLVESARASGFARPHLPQSNALVATPAARDYGMYGSEAVVAVLDTGIDAAHPTFSGRVVQEACYSSNWSTFSATNLCPLGGTDDFTQHAQFGPGAAALTKCIDVDCFHGTHVASIAAGSNMTYNGMAPQADIIAIQVFSRVDDETWCGAGLSPCVLSFEHDQLAALEYVATLSETYNVASVNMSLGGGMFFAACDWSNLKPAVDALELLDIVVVASSGNDGYAGAIGDPACISNVISVGSVNDTSDTVSSFSNGAAILDMLAPGDPITAAYPAGLYATAAGTSMAAPHVAGAIAIMKAHDATLTWAQYKSLLVNNGNPVLDTRNGLTFPRLNIGVTAQALIGALAGDANDDGALDAADLLLVQRHITGAVTLGAAAMLRCDLHPPGDPDGTLTVTDLVLLERLLLGYPVP
jgi:subtilisin family serine protease